MELFKIIEQGREQIRTVFNLPGGNDWLGRKSKKHREQSFILAWGDEGGPSWGGREAVPTVSGVVASDSQIRGCLSWQHPIFLSFMS